MDFIRKAANQGIFATTDSDDLTTTGIIAKFPSKVTKSLKLITSTAVALVVQNNFSYQAAQAFTLNLCTTNLSLIPICQDASTNPSAPIGFDPLVYGGVVKAAQEWSNIFTDNVTVNLKIELKNLDHPASAIEERYGYTYNEFYQKLQADITSSDDQTAFKALQDGSSSSSFKMLINLTKDNPNGSGSLTPYFDSNGDDNNKIIEMNKANAKALGLPVTYNNDFFDATIEIDSKPSYPWDFDPAEIDSQKLDLVGVVRHEIGHALGFVSGVDILDSYGSQLNSKDYTSVTPLDLFRFSPQSIKEGLGVFDWTARKTINSTPFSPYFSIDGGVTKPAFFSTGVKNGNGQQASHWQNSSIGIMGATVKKGQKLPSISNLDMKALDVIGWNLKSGPGIKIIEVPEPSEKLGLIAVGLGFLLTLKNRFRAKNRQ